MSHEEPQVARRSVSHGALNSSYALPTRASSVILDSGHHLVPYFKPLRSIREHGHTFLDPAASADGMLRKTTETGNIGLFSIKSGGPTALRPRASLGDLRQPHRPVSRSGDRPSAHDDRKRLPSYRDSTSEIISMYGSDNQSSAKSASGTLSPWDDCPPRSNSMTTCGSKSQTLPRNICMQQAHDVLAGAQRPRSPYPYPTRLPRPGIRPSSPALTENGNVDYSRMVEIDRIPQRTIHHPHKPLFPFKTTRDQHAPLSLRYGVNQSTRSLSNDRGPTQPSIPPTSRRTPLPNHLHPWRLRLRPRLGSESSDQSMRTMSLTSTNGGYSGPPAQTSKLQIPDRKPPIFYDYSEDFEDAVEPPPDLQIANPTPTRVSTSFRPGLAEDEADVRSESADEGVDHVVDYLRRMTMIESLKDQDEGSNQEDHEEYDEDHDMDIYRPVSQLQQRDSPAQISHYDPAEEAPVSSPVIPTHAHALDDSYISTATISDHQNDMDRGNPEGLSHTTESLANGLVSEASTAESPPDPETPGFGLKLAMVEPVEYGEDSMILNHLCPGEGTNANDIADEVVESQMPLTESQTPVVQRCNPTSGVSTTAPYRHSGGRKDSRFYSLNSGLSDLASFVKYVDKHMQSLEYELAEQHGAPFSVADLIPGSMSEPAADHGRHHFQTMRETSAPPRKSSLANQSRSYIGLKVETPVLVDEVDEVDQFQVVSTRSGPTLVPQPISPAKMLRLKNSIPHLMKALPPLPSYSPASESPFNPTLVPVEFEPFDFSRLTDARSTLIESFGSHSHDDEVPQGYEPFAIGRAVRKPKLKLKAPASQPLGRARRTRPRQHEQDNTTQSETSGTRQSSAGEYSMVPVKRRLPIKLSRPTLESLAVEGTGTVKRRLGADKSSTVSDLASSQPLDLFTTASAALEMTAQYANPLAVEQSSPSDREYGTLPAAKATPMARIQRITVVDEGRGASLDAQLDALHSPRARTETITEDGMQSSFSDSIAKPQRGLRKRLSILKLRLTESRHHQHLVTINTTARDRGDHRAVTRSQSPHAIRDLLVELDSRKGHHIALPTRTVRSQWNKLVKGAKHRLRAWGKNRHKSE